MDPHGFAILASLTFHEYPPQSKLQHSSICATKLQNTRKSITGQTFYEN